MPISINRLFLFLLCTGATLALFTSLRFSFFGLGEILIILTFFLTNISAIPDFNFKNFPFTFFWLIYIFSSLIGAFINLTFITTETGTTVGLSIDLFAYIFILITSFVLETNINQKNLDPFKALKYFVLLSSFMLSIFLLISFYTPTFLGFNLMYESNFAPLVNNVHQISMFYIMLPFLCAAILEKEIKNNSKKMSFIIVLFYICLIISTISMSFTAGATKAFVGFWLAVASAIFLFMFSMLNKTMKAFVIYFIFVLITFIIYHFDLYLAFLAFFAEADVGGGRAYFYKHSFSLINESPIFGRGPGAHIWRAELYWDIHQTFLTVFVQAGIIGFISFIILLSKFVKDLSPHSLFFASMVPLLIYALGGDILRRLPIWILIILVFYSISEFNKKNSKKITIHQK